MEPRGYAPITCVKGYMQVNASSRNWSTRSLEKPIIFHQIGEIEVGRGSFTNRQELEEPAPLHPIILC
jgi:hypothetical protein